MHLEKVICQKLIQVRGMEEDKLQCCTLPLPVTFLLAKFLNFSQQFRNQRKILSCFGAEHNAIKKVLKDTL
jgi:hypothetical protein